MAIDSRLAHPCTSLAYFFRHISSGIYQPRLLQDQSPPTRNFIIDSKNLRPTYNGPQQRISSTLISYSTKRRLYFIRQFPHQHHHDSSYIDSPARSPHSVSLYYSSFIVALRRTQPFHQTIFACPSARHQYIDQHLFVTLICFLPALDYLLFCDTMSS